MYNFDLNFTYNDDDEYQKNLLSCFSLTDYDEKSLSEKMDKLYEYLTKNEQFKSLFKQMAAIYMSEDLEIGFAFLFSYTYFKDFHDFIGEYHKTGKVNDEKIKQFTAK